MNERTTSPASDRSDRWRISTQEGFLACYDATVRDAHRYAYRLTGDRSRAEDLVQDVYLELLRSARSGSVIETGPGRIMVAVRHRFLDQVRASGREERRLRLVWSRDETDEGDDDGETLVDVPLTDRERAALTMRYVDGLSVHEVAQSIGASVRATESLLARARARVRNEGDRRDV